MKKLIARMLPALLLLGLFTQIPSTSRAQGQVRTIVIHAHRFAFSPSEITLKKGEPVKLQLISDDVAHSLLIPGLGINQLVTKAHPAEITVTPENAGDFHGQCGRFCGSGHGSMLFTVHVKD